MADTDHLSKLNEGVDQWNSWRAQNPDITPDLSNANLSRITNPKLSGANLTNANLAGTNFDYAYMKGARLAHSRACGAKFHNATLIEADMAGAVLVALLVAITVFWPREPTYKGATVYQWLSLTNGEQQQAILTLRTK